MKRERIQWIDIAKGIGIILVVYGHISFRPVFWNVWLCSFHMPLFFFMAGVTYNADKYQKFSVFIKSKVKTLLIPYFIFACFTWVWNLLLGLLSLFKDGTVVNWKYQIKQLVGIFVQIRATDYGIGVWFIPCIFMAFIFLWCIQKLSKISKWGGIILTIVFLIFGYLYCTYINLKLPWGVDAAFIAVFFMEIGVIGQKYLCKKFGSYKKLIIIGICAFIVNLTFCIANYKIMDHTVGMWSNNYGNLLYFLAESFAGIVFIISLSNIVQIKLVSELGRNSIYYYGFHILILNVLSKFALKTIKIENDVVAFLVCTLLVVITLGLLRIVFPLYNKLYKFTLKVIERKKLNNEII